MSGRKAVLLFTYLFGFSRGCGFLEHNVTLPTFMMKVFPKLIRTFPRSMTQNSIQALCCCFWMLSLDCMLVSWIIVLTSFWWNMYLPSSNFQQPCNLYVSYYLWHIKSLSLSLDAKKGLLKANQNKFCRPRFQASKTLNNYETVIYQM